MGDAAVCAWLVILIASEIEIVVKCKMDLHCCPTKATQPYSDYAALKSTMRAAQCDLLTATLGASTAASECVGIGHEGNLVPCLTTYGARRQRSQHQP